MDLELLLHKSDVRVKAAVVNAKMESSENKFEGKLSCHPCLFAYGMCIPYDTSIKSWDILHFIYCHETRDSLVMYLSLNATSSLSSDIGF